MSATRQPGDVQKVPAKDLRRAVRRIRNAWRTTTGPGVTLVKSDARWLLSATDASQVVSWIGHRAYMVDPTQYQLFSMGSFAAGDYVAEYVSGAFAYAWTLTSTTHWAAAIEPNGLVYNGGSAYSTPSAGFTSHTLASADLIWSEAITHGGGAISVEFGDSLYTDNRWAMWNNSATGSFMTGYPTGGFTGNSVFGVRTGNYLKLQVPDTSLALTTADSTYRANPMSLPLLYTFRGHSGVSYTINYEVSARIPGLESSYFGTADYIYLGADLLIESAWTGTPYEMTILTQSTSEVIVGQGLATPITGALEWLYNPSIPHTGSYVEITATIA